MNRELQNIDLSNKDREKVQSLLKKFIPKTEVWAYGSRVTHTAQSSSDLDMVAFATKAQSSAVSSLREAFDESSLPFRVDLFVWEELPKAFHKNIEADHVVLQIG